MSILIDATTPVILQGFTGDKATFHAKEMIEYGTKVVGGVTPGKGGQTHLDRPVFNTVKDAVKATGAEASLAFVPPPYAADALMEAADAGLRLVCIITDGIPAQDMMRVKRYLRRYPKPKRTTDLKRLRNIAANPRVSLLVDHYDEDWTRLWWVRVDGSARVIDDRAEADRAIDLLVDRYPQYRRVRPGGPVVAISIDRISGWSGASGPD